METAAAAGGETRRPDAALTAEFEEVDDKGAVTFRSEDEEAIPPALINGFPAKSGLKAARVENADRETGCVSAEGALLI